jgi:hypothetical protein
MRLHDDKAATLARNNARKAKAFEQEQALQAESNASNKSSEG